MNTRGTCPSCGLPLRVDRFYFDRATRAVIGNGGVRQLTERQAEMFEYLWARRGVFVLSYIIAQEIGWQGERNKFGSMPRVQSCAKRLKKVLRPLGIHLEGSRAKLRGGYRITADAAVIVSAKKI